jgi:hypothetical protein
MAETLYTAYSCLEGPGPYSNTVSWCLGPVRAAAIRATTTWLTATHHDPANRPDRRRDCGSVGPAAGPPGGCPGNYRPGPT